MNTPERRYRPLAGFRLALATCLEYELTVNPLSANLTNWSNTIKQVSIFDHFVGLALKALIVNTF